MHAIHKSPYALQASSRRCCSHTGNSVIHWCINSSQCLLVLFSILGEAVDATMPLYLADVSIELTVPYTKLVPYQHSFYHGGQQNPSFYITRVMHDDREVVVPSYIANVVTSASLACR